MRIKNRLLTATLYTYVEPVNAKYAKAMGKEWGSFSNYVNYLIAKDSGNTKSIETSKEMREIFLTPSPARSSKPRATKKKAAKKKAKGKKSKRGSARVSTKTSEASSASARLSPATRRPKTSSKKTRTKSAKKPGVIRNLVKAIRRQPNVSANGVVA
jgi:hypothetical protein